MDAQTIAGSGTSRWHQLLWASIAVVLTFLLAPSDTVASTSIDGSCHAGLALAYLNRLRWGPDIIFVNGPLGTFSFSPFYFYGQSVTALIYQVALVIFLFLGVAGILRSRCTNFPALMLSLITVALIVVFATYWLNPYIALLVAFVWAATPLLQETPSSSTVLKTTLALAVLAGFELLAKLNTGFYILAVALALSLLHDWRAVRRHLYTVAAFALAVATFWMLSGQRIDGLPRWIVDTKQASFPT